MERFERNLSGSTCRHVDLGRKISEFNKIKTDENGAEIQDEKTWNRSDLKERRGCQALREVRKKQIT